MTIQIFKRVELPSRILISELIVWVAFGRAPELGMEEIKESPGCYRWDDWRTNIDCAYEGVPDFINLPFSQSEFSLIGVEVDYDDYIRRWTTTVGDTGDEIMRRHEEVHKRLQHLSGYEERLEESLREAKLADEIRDIERPFIPFIDRAYSKVFNALSSGNLKCEAWVFEDPQDEECEPVLKEVPFQSWTLRGFDFNACELLDDKVQYHAVQTEVSEALTYFPTPEIKATEITGTLVGDSFLAATESSHVPTRKPRGRPPKGGAIVRDATKSVFREKKRKGELTGKKESQIQEVIDFVKLAFKETISRSTAQSYLDDL